jgi:hypothetical protein
MGASARLVIILIAGPTNCSPQAAINRLSSLRKLLYDSQRNSIAHLIFVGSARWGGPERTREIPFIVAGDEPAQ